MASHSYKEAVGRARGCRCAKRARVPLLSTDSTTTICSTVRTRHIRIRSINGSSNNGVDRNAVIQLQHRSVKLAFTATCLFVRPKEWKLSVPKHGRADSLPRRANTQSEHFGQTSRSQLSKYVGVSLCFQRQKVCCVHSHLRAIVLNN